MKEKWIEIIFWTTVISTKLWRYSEHWWLPYRVYDLSGKVIILTSPQSHLHSSCNLLITIWFLTSQSSLQTQVPPQVPLRTQLITLIKSSLQIAHTSSVSITHSIPSTLSLSVSTICIISSCCACMLCSSCCWWRCYKTWENRFVLCLQGCK